MSVYPFMDLQKKIPFQEPREDHREEGAHRERNHAAHSSWGKLRGGCCGFQLRHAQTERSLEQQGQDSGWGYRKARKQGRNWVDGKEKRIFFSGGVWHKKSLAEVSASSSSNALNLLWRALVFPFFSSLDSFWSHLFILVISISCLNLFMTGVLLRQRGL